VDISLSKLPWYGQLGAFVLLAAASIWGFYTYYVTDAEAELALKQTHLTALKADVNKGLAAARGLGDFQAQVTDLEHRLANLQNVLPEEKDVADTLRRIQGLAMQSNLSLLKFTPIGTKQQPLYLEVPYRIEAEGSYHNLGLFFDRVSKFPRIIDIGEIAISAKPRQDPNSTIVADCTATTFVLQDAGGGRGGRGAPPAR